MENTQRTPNQNLERIIGLCREMLVLADRGDSDRADDGCGIVYGNVRDAAYKLKKMALEELNRHQSILK